MAIRKFTKIDTELEGGGGKCEELKEGGEE